MDKIWRLSGLAEYESLKETAYLLGTPANALHLSESMQQINSGKVVIKTSDTLPD